MEGSPLPHLPGMDLQNLSGKDFSEKDLPLLRDVVRECQRLQVGGRLGLWRDFLLSPKATCLSKRTRTTRDPRLHSWNVLAEFVKSLARPALERVLKKQRLVGPGAGVQENTGVPGNDVTTNRGGTAESSKTGVWDLVARTRAHPRYKNSYRLPSSKDGWVVVPRTVRDLASEPTLLALDCEMCLSSESAHELVRVALVDAEGKVVYDRLVKPQAKVLDYREGVTGISEATLKDVTYTRADAQADIVKVLSGNIVLVGHSLDNDLIALRLDFQPVVDTSYLFRYKKLNTCSPSLADLHRLVLDAVLREEGKPHDCSADAFGAMALAQYEMQFGPTPELEPPPLKVSKDDLKKLMVHSIPPGLTAEDLLANFRGEGCPADITVEGDPAKEKKVFLVFGNPAHADNAFKMLRAQKKEKDSRGRLQKTITLCRGLAQGQAVRVRKMAAHNGLAFGADVRETHDRTPGERAFTKKMKLNSAQGMA